MKDWQEDKRASDVYLDEIKQILGLYLIGEPPIEEDQQRNTDLIVLKMDAMRIACRVRTNYYLHARNYRDEFTIRSKRPSGMKTELRKILEGWGDYMFYGFGDESGETLAYWNLFDLKVFRGRFLSMVHKQIVPKDIPNEDESSFFKAFLIKDFPACFVIAESESDRQEINAA